MNVADSRYLSHRRRAAVGALSGYLEPDSLRDALWLLQQEYTAPGVSCLIAFVDKVTARFGIETKARKQLYVELFRLLNAVDDRELPADPWPMMNALPPNSSQHSATVATLRPVGISGGMAKRPGPADHVFGEFMKIFLRLSCSQSPDEQLQFRAALDTGLEQMTALGATRTVLRRWIGNIERSTVTLSLETEQMSAVVHAAYLAAGLVFGRLEADNLLESALGQASRLKEAQLFPPERFLWTGYLSSASTSH